MKNPHKRQRRKKSLQHRRRVRRRQRRSLRRSQHKFLSPGAYDVVLRGLKKHGKTMLMQFKTSGPSTVGKGDPASQHGAGSAADFQILAKAMANVGVSMRVAAQNFMVQMKSSQKIMEELFAKFAEGLEVPEPKVWEPPGESPDIAGTVVGFRVWKVDGHASGLALGSIGRPWTWVPGINTARLCEDDSFVREREAEVHPQPDCRCGFWGMWGPSETPYYPKLQRISPDIRDRVDYSGFVLGRIAGWGVVVEHELGFRSQFAEIKELYYHGAVGEKAFTTALGDYYEVPVSYMSFDWMYD